MKSLKSIRTAVIGTGNMGAHHVRVLSKLSTLVAVADKSEAIGKPTAQNYNCTYYNNHLGLIENEIIDAAVIAVPTKFHAEIALDFIKKRIPILIEKPIATDIKTANMIYKKSDRNNSFVMVGHIERFNPAVVKLKKIIASRKLGKILNLLSIRVGISPPVQKNSDVAIELGIHDVDVFTYLLDEVPVKTQIDKRRLFKNNKADIATMMFTYKFATALIQTNWITPIKMRKLFVTGIDGFAELNYINQELILYDKILNTKASGDYFDLISISDAPKKEVYISKKEPLKQELQFFLKNLHNPNASNLIDSIKALEILQSRTTMKR